MSRIQTVDLIKQQVAGAIRDTMLFYEIGQTEALRDFHTGVAPSEMSKISAGTVKGKSLEELLFVANQLGVDFDLEVDGVLASEYESKADGVSA